MSFSPEKKAPDRSFSIPPISVRSELERVLSSRRFSASERHKAFLRFVVEECLNGHGSGIKELTIAMEVFGRDSSFDPRTDSIVRSEARNLRARLNEYYLGEGSNDPIVIELPKGSYVPAFRQREVVVPNRRPGMRILLASALVVGLSACGLWLVHLWPNSRFGSDYRTIAVLPFLNLSGTSANDYVADGIAEDLTTRLGQVASLRVAARTSAFQFRAKSQDVRRIGHDLSVGLVLEGSLRKEGSLVRITAQLVDTSSGYHLWAREYNCDAAIFPNVESEIVGEVLEFIGLKHNPVATVTHIPPAEARDAYWRGRYLHSTNWQDAGKGSIAYYERAVSIDPLYAEAWAGLAAAHANVAFELSGAEEAEEVAKSRAAAKRAMELDDRIPQTYLAIASARYSYDRNWPAAETAYLRALALNPSLASAHRSYALGLMSRGNFEQSLAHLNTAQQLDPVSILTTNNMATTLYCARRYDEAILAAQRHLEMDASFYPAHSIIGLCEVQKGNWNAAISEFQQALAQVGKNIMLQGQLGYALAQAGRQTEARATLAELEQLDAIGDAGVGIAIVHAGLGEKAKAIESLRKASAAHVPDVMFIAVHPIFDSLRKEPDFQALCRSLDLPVR